MANRKTEDILNLIPTASDDKRLLEKMMYYNEPRADGKIYYKPPWTTRWRWKNFSHWIRYLGLNFDRVDRRYKRLGRSFKDAVEKPSITRWPWIKTYLEKKRDKKKNSDNNV